MDGVEAEVSSRPRSGLGESFGLASLEEGDILGRRKVQQATATEKG